MLKKVNLYKLGLLLLVLAFLRLAIWVVDLLNAPEKRIVTDDGATVYNLNIS